MNGKSVAIASGVVFAPLVLVLGICILFVAAVAGGAAEHEGDTSDGSPGRGAPGQVAGINPVLLSAYSHAAGQVRALRPQCSGMHWSVIAGIGKVESEHAAGHTIAPNGDITPRIIGPRLDGSGAGGNTTAITDTDHGRWDGDPVFDRAVGPLQFLPSTWDGGAGQDGNGDGVKDPHNAFDAALATAVYLCGTGTSNLNDQAQLRKAVLRYNQSATYADEVTGYIHQYDQLSTGPAGAPGTAVGGSAGAVIQVALAQQGLPYVWGGGDINGPTGGGFDCSGLMRYAFHKGAGITLPRTSQEMRSAGQHIDKTGIQPGDLIIFNNDGNWGHVGLYLGGNQMVNAPRPGKNVETTTLDYWQQFPWEVRRVVSGT